MADRSGISQPTLSRVMPDVLGVARWPGSTHDAFIWRNSSVGRRLEAGAVRDGWLLGDSGYPLKRWLLNPFHNPQNAEERQYNVRHSQARAVVERTIGLLKGRWRCLDATGGKLCYKPDKVCQIVRARVLCFTIWHC
ncbi:hypothetical protein JOQ06_026874 [Pogonophryne albipinna]|uniref:DDE Tnp4 domain-containing protein n=1 Tax=Pogonophryne albipinna TaxID=1090488 RepID=A0AAD6B9I2_9TELE|nr:hypothetical protein JOQ06_026874 [Pogonophryne albipinna]